MQFPLRIKLQFHINLQIKFEKLFNFPHLQQRVKQQNNVIEIYSTRWKGEA